MMDSMEQMTREMLIAVRAEKRAAQERVRLLEEREKTLEGWLRNGSQAELPVTVTQAETKDSSALRAQIVKALTLRGLLSELLKDGLPRTNQQIAEFARERGIVFQDARSINAVMLGFMRAGMVDRHADKWIPKKGGS